MAIVVLQLDPQAPDVAIHDVALPPSSALMGTSASTCRSSASPVRVTGKCLPVTATEVSCRSGLRSAMIGVWREPSSSAAFHPADRKGPAM